MLDFVPFARAWRQMGDGDRRAGLVGETLDLALPEAYAVAPHGKPLSNHAAAAISGNDEGRCLGIACLAEAIPPAANTLDREGCRVGVDADVDPALVVGDVVVRQALTMRDAIGRDFAEFRDLEGMHPNRFGLAFGTQLLAAILEVADQLFLLGVDGDGGGTRRDGCLDRRIDVLELRVAIRMARALAGFPVGLAAVFQLPQQHANQLLAHLEALAAQRLGNVPLAAADPAQRRFGIPTDRTIDQRLERCQKTRLLLDGTFASAAAPPNPMADLEATRLQ